VGFEGQTRIAEACVVIMGADVACEIAARSLAAAGVGRLRWLGDRRGRALPTFARALMASNPELDLELAAGSEDLAGDVERRDDGAWGAELTGAAAIIRSGIAGPAMLPMLSASVRLGLPAVVMLRQADGIRVVSFRRQGPCPHVAFDQAFDAPSRVAGGSTVSASLPVRDGEAVVAGHLAAAETLVVLSQATTSPSRARAIHIPFDSGGSAGAGPRAVDIPWTPECIACGGSGKEMSFP
jgi:hypothetical protein